jgi:hypothetical protein
MNTNLKVLLTAMSIATLASPVMAKSDSHRYAAQPEAGISRTAPVSQGNQIHINDAVHVAFPQQDSGI